MFFIYSNQELIDTLLDRDLSDYQTLADLLGMLRLYEEENPKEAHRINKVVRENAAREAVKQGSMDFFQLNKAALLFDAPFEFDAFMQYIEIDREPKERFYLPRRKVLKRVVDEMQKLADDELDALFVSMPPRAGKSQLGIFFLTWLIGRNPEKTNLMSGYSDKLTRSFYDGVLEIILDSATYKFYDVFPDCRLVDTNSKNETLDFFRRKRYPSLTCRSIDGSLTGNTECNSLLYGDDLVSGIIEALSPVRMESLWGKVTNDLLSRRKKGCKLLFVGTRWATTDVLGRLQTLFETDKSYREFRTKSIVLAAFDENGESNFDYEYGVGYSTIDFQRIRATMSEPDFKAQYMQTPLDREGRLFRSDEMNFFNGTLPPMEPDKIVCAVDVAYGGGDYLCAVCGYVYGQDIFVKDVVFSQEGIDVTVPLIEALLIRNAPHTTYFEANNGGFLLADKVSVSLKDKGYRFNITSRVSPSNASKLTRILVAAPTITERFYFIDEDNRSPEYRDFFNQLIAFSTLGKNDHDDAPDATAMLTDAIMAGPSVQVFKRPF